MRKLEKEGEKSNTSITQSFKFEESRFSMDGSGRWNFKCTLYLRTVIFTP